MKEQVKGGATKETTSQSSSKSYSSPTNKSEHHFSWKFEFPISGPGGKKPFPDLIDKKTILLTSVFAAIFVLYFSGLDSGTEITWRDFVTK